MSFLLWLERKENQGKVFIGGSFCRSPACARLSHVLFRLKQNVRNFQQLVVMWLGAYWLSEFARADGKFCRYRCPRSIRYDFEPNTSPYRPPHLVNEYILFVNISVCPMQNSFLQFTLPLPGTFLGLYMRPCLTWCLQTDESRVQQSNVFYISKRPRVQDGCLLLCVEAKGRPPRKSLAWVDRSL